MSVSLLLLKFETAGDAPKGDCSIPGLEDYIALESFSWRLKTTTALGGGKHATAHPGELTVSKHFDSASVGMCRMMANDVNFSRATLLFIDPTSPSNSAGKPSFDSIVELVLTDGYIENISIRAAESGKVISVTEDVVLSFKESITVTYLPQEKGSQRRVAKGHEFKLRLPEVR